MILGLHILWFELNKNNKTSDLKRIIFVLKFLSPQLAVKKMSYEIKNSGCPKLQNKILLSTIIPLVRTLLFYNFGSVQHFYICGLKYLK